MLSEKNSSRSVYSMKYGTHNMYLRPCLMQLCNLPLHHCMARKEVLLVMPIAEACIWCSAGGKEGANSTPYNKDYVSYLITKFFPLS